MPHIDRKYLSGLAPTSGPMPPAMLAGTQPPQALKRPLPPREADSADQPPDKARGQLGLPKLNIRTHEVSPDRVIAQLFGRAIHVDEHTGVCDLWQPKENRHGH